MHTLKIKRNLELKRHDTDAMIYNVNDIRVYIGYNGRFVHYGSKEAESEPLIVVATELAIKLSGSITFDSNDTDILDFLKCTKCI